MLPIKFYPKLLNWTQVNLNTACKTFLTLMCLVWAGICQSESVAISKTKTKLKELESKIIQLQQVLSTAHDKQGVLSHELSITEKKIGSGVQQLREIQHTISHRQVKIYELQAQIVQLSSQLKTHQELLSKHIRTRYKMGEYQPVKWLLNQETPYQLSRLLTFYQYLIKSRQHLIEKVQDIKKNITINQAALQKELEKQQELHQQLNTNQKKLEQEKSYHKALINTLNKDIQTNEQRLEEYKRNKANLSRLLASLVQQSVIQTQTPFIHMRRKLLMPVHSNRNSIEKTSQGVTFYVPEGTPVSAVYGGKVVFSDWLKGYGLLLIIDHGQGFMTLYAHNQSLFKPKGSTVYQGEQIASVGHSGGFKQNSLYFEIRQRGKAVSPLDWLS
jgi:septal ring factor EnvC (AmiA/AmiB activator)